MSHTCQIETLPACPTLSVRRRAAVAQLPQTFGAADDQLAAYLASRGVPYPGRFYAAYHNMDMQNLDVEIGFFLDQPVEGEGEITAGEFAAGRYGVCLYTGSYQEIGPAYGALSQVIAAQGAEPTGLVIEQYLNDPQVTPPEELQTRILMPLKG